MRNFILSVLLLSLLVTVQTSSQTKLWGGSWTSKATITVANQKTTDSILTAYELPYTITEALVTVAVTSTYGDSLIIQVEGSNAYGSDTAWTILGTTDSAKFNTNAYKSTTYRQHKLVPTMRYMRIRAFRNTVAWPSYSVQFLPRRFYDSK